VGNGSKFNQEGIVPVNFSGGELILDEIKIMSENFYANTKKQPLAQHLFAVGYLAHCLIKQLLEDKNLAMAAYVAGGLHDIGKLDPEFQSWLTGIIYKNSGSDTPDDGLHIDKGKFTFENHARHNEISLYLYYLLDDDTFKGINKRNKDLIKHVIYWHHAKPIRKDEFTSLDFINKKLNKSLGSTKLKDFFKIVTVVVESVNEISKQYLSTEDLQLTGCMKSLDDDKLYGLERIKLPDYKCYSSSNDEIKDYVNNIQENAKQSIARAAVISADRLISALTKEQLANHIEGCTLMQLVDLTFNKESDLSNHIKKCLQGFDLGHPNSRRNVQQREAAINLANAQGIAVLNGPAGCGKTKIALEWALKSNVKKIIWICPRVQVCEGLFMDLTSNEYLPNAHIEICTGEFKVTQVGGVKFPTMEGKEFSGDIVLTTIDQVINAIITHRNVTSLVDFMTTHVVFDEYHEYTNMPAFNLLFAELVQCKKLQGLNAKTLLVSATPNYFFLENLLEIHRDDVIGVESFNQCHYQINFKEFDETKIDSSNPLYSGQPKNSIVISNTATTAQLSFIANQVVENAVLFHSKFKHFDKVEIFRKILASFRQGGCHNFDILRSGPIVQAALNITCENMVTEFTNAENWLQRLGRLDRFGENKSVNLFVVAVPQTLAAGNRNGSCARFLNGQHILNSAVAWYDFLKCNLPMQTLVVAELYQLYENFYASEAGKRAVESDLKSALKNSVQVIGNKVLDPISYSKKNKIEEKIQIKKSSLRGDNRFVQMAVCKVLDNGSFKFLDEYACNNSNDFFTMSVNEIEGYDPNGDKNLISFMYQKHHKILSIKNKKKYAQAYKSFVIKNEAVDSEHPIFVSYTEKDLELCNDKPHSHAIYYAVSERQPIGAISINKLNNQSVNKE
jgi:CRISPR-associated endonuclease/helicase Cas3